MKRIHKLLWWFVGMPIYSAIHFFIAYGLYGLLWYLLDGPSGVSNWVVMLIRILFIVVSPFMYLISFIDRFIVVPQFWYIPISFILSAIAWYFLLTWVITSRLFKNARAGQGAV